MDSFVEPGPAYDQESISSSSSGWLGVSQSLIQGLELQDVAYVSTSTRVSGDAKSQKSQNIIAQFPPHTFHLHDKHGGVPESGTYTVLHERVFKLRSEDEYLTKDLAREKILSPVHVLTSGMKALALSLDHHKPFNPSPLGVARCSCKPINQLAGISRSFESVDHF